MMKINSVEKSSTSNVGCNISLIQEQALFKNVPQNRLSWLKDLQAKQIKVPARSTIFKEGKPHDYIYTLFSGWGIIYKTVSNNGKRQILRFLLPGDLIGFQADKANVIAYSSATVTSSVLCAFSRKKFHSLLKESPELAVRILEMECMSMSLCQNHLMATGRKTARESIAFILMELYCRVKKQVSDSFCEDNNSIAFPITQEDMGDALGLTNIHVNRVVNELMREKLIYLNKKRLTILNEKKLSEIAEFSPTMIEGNTLI